MAALRHLVRVELRQRWRGLLALSLMAGLVAGVVLGAAAGARRTASALDRFRAATASMDVNVQAQSPEQRNALLYAARTLPHVEVAAPYAVVPIGAESEVDLAIALPVDGKYGTAVDRPRVLAGRLPAQNAAEEVIISEYVADTLGLRLGDQTAFPTFVPKDLMDAISGGEFRGLHGPPITVRVVGIGRLPQEFESGEEDGGPVLLGTEALYRRVVGKAGMFDDAFGARLRDPARDEVAFATAIRNQAGSEEGLSVGTADESYASSGRDALRFSANAIFIFALLAFASGTVVVLQMANRERSEAHARGEVFRALGSTRRERFGAVAIPQFIAAVGAVAFGFIIAIAGSFIFPAGFARSAEPRTGLSIDVLALGGGAALLIAVWVFLIAAFALRRDDGTEARRRSPSIRLSIAPAPDLGVARALRSGGFGAGATTAVLLASTG
ncbi:MAG TPA: FtsX-like permease family protein, partial [Acidimicrobiia bacterium]|nr:FtsX-like permease family protein [Acidimicrobiia bacterium]